MDYSYTAIYDSYAKFCNRVGCPVPSFEQWMKDREAPPEHKILDAANDILRSSVPGSPVPACSPR
jgi:hypothetical protein